jgi:hypothetical protein
MKFYLTGLGKDRFLMGHPFLWTFNPTIDGKEGPLLGGEVETKTSGFREGLAKLHIKKTKKSEKWAYHVKETTDSANPERVSVSV